MKGLFITGTDTEVGKTVASAALVAGLRDHAKIRYWKPIQTGIEQDDDTKTVRNLAGCSPEEIHDFGVRLKKPLSPHLAASLANTEISVASTLIFSDHSDNESFWIVEGAGGILVPLNKGELMIDLISELSLPLLIVARSGLGTINHTLLTIEAIRKYDLDIVGVILNGPQNLENKKAIEHYGQVPVLAELPKFEKLNNSTLADWSRQKIRNNEGLINSLR